MSTSLGDNARSACQNVSSTAENIKAAGSATADAINAAWFGGGLSAFKSDNEIQTNVKNTLGIDLSSADVTQIKNSCQAVVSGSQSNYVGNSNCAYCQNHNCVLDGIQQTNKANVTADCVAKATVEVVRTKDITLQQQALMQAIQESKGVGAANSASANICNFMSVNASSKDFTDLQNECLANANQKQSNTIDGCYGEVRNIVQQNDYRGYAQCMLSAEFSSYSNDGVDVLQSSDVSVSQKATGLDPFAIFAIIFIVLIAIGLIIALPLLIPLLKLGKAAKRNKKIGREAPLPPISGQ